MAAFRVTVACSSDDELQVLPEESLRHLYEALADQATEGTTLTDSIEPGGVRGFITIELESIHRGDVEWLLAGVCSGTDLSPGWFVVASI